MVPVQRSSAASTAAKLLTIAVVLSALWWRAQVPALAAAMLSATIVGGSVVLFDAATRSTRLPVAARGIDRACLAVTALSVTFPAVILLAALTDSWIVSAGLAGIFAAFVRIRHVGDDELEPSVLTIPATAYGVAAAYAVWSVAGPFAHFTPESLVRELYTDGFQRFGAVHALAEHIPPANAFVAGVPFRYYWFALAPMGALFRRVSDDPFAVWKVLLILQAFCFVVSLWWVAAWTLRSRAAAWIATLLLMVFASIEILWHPRLGEALRLLGPTLAGVRTAIEALTAIDPDHLVGIIVTYSDQLLMEDFLYLPQNGAALALMLATVFVVQQRRFLMAAWVIAVFVGTNTFFAVCTGAALVVLALVQCGPAQTMTLVGWLSVWSLLWAAVSRIIPVPESRGFLALVTAAAMAGSWLLMRVERSQPFASERVAVVSRIATWGIGALFFSMATIVLLRPRSGTAGLLLNYSPALVMAIPFLLQRLQSGPMASAEWFEPTLLFLVVFGASYYFLVFFLVAPFQVELPPGVHELALRLGDAINPFNFTHKVAKGARLMWCLLAALAALPAIEWTIRSRTRVVVCGAVLCGVLPVSAATTVLRPMTYLRNAPVPEAAAAAFLRSRSPNLSTVILIEDIRRSQINQLVPVSTYFISSWTADARSLSSAVGTWADQYVPANAHALVKAREARNLSIFRSADVGAEIRRLRDETRIDYVLMRKARDLGAGFRLVVDAPGGYLYQVEQRPR